MVSTSRNKPLNDPDDKPTDGSIETEEKTWVALVSGLSVGAQEAPADLKAQLLVEWLTGEDGGQEVGSHCGPNS